MTDSEIKLLQFNNDGVMSNLIAAEEHLVNTDKNEINDTWCLKKHLKFSAIGHHLNEAINHASTIDSELADKYRDFRGKLEEFIGHPDLAKLRYLRNNFRSIIGDPTLQKDCKLCALDREGSFKNSASLNSDINNTHEQDLTNIENNGGTMNGKTTVMTLVGAAAGGAGGKFLGETADAQGAILPGLKNSVLANGVVGVALTFGAPKLLKSEKAAPFASLLQGFGLGLVALAVRDAVPSGTATGGLRFTAAPTAVAPTQMPSPTVRQVPLQTNVFTYKGAPTGTAAYGTATYSNGSTSYIVVD